MLLNGRLGRSKQQLAVKKSGISWASTGEFNHESVTLDQQQRCLCFYMEFFVGAWSLVASFWVYDNHPSLQFSLKGLDGRLFPMGSRQI